MGNVFFRMFSHLLPRSLAFRIREGGSPWKYDDGSKYDDEGLTWGPWSGGRAIDRFFAGLSESFIDYKSFVDLIVLDYYSATTRQLGEWEYQLGLQQATATADRRSNISAARKSTGGQGPYYLQSVVQAAGFDLYVHEWFDLPSAPADPRNYTVPAEIGTVRCGMPSARCGATGARCNGFLVNDPLYLVNKRLVQEAPPPISDDPDGWPYFLYWGAATFPNHASVPASRRAELERLLLKICPSQHWLVVLVDYV